MTWRVVIPVKPPGLRKSRLAPALDASARAILAERMLRHVLRIASAMPEIEPIVLSPELPSGWTGAWLADWTELNAMLAVLRREHPERGFAVVNADLPMLACDDLHILLAATRECGMAIAADRHQTGTNAVAMAAGVMLPFHFGPGSLKAFRKSGGPSARLVNRPGLSHDIDSPSDLELVAALCSG